MGGFDGSNEEQHQYGHVALGEGMAGVINTHVNVNQR